MTDVRQALEQAREALDLCNKHGFVLADHENTITAALSAVSSALQAPDQQDGTILVRLHRPDGYEDVHPELILADANINPAFEPELYSAETQGDAKDAARLDWLDSDGCTSVFKLGGTWYTRYGYGSPHYKAKNIRAAIDAAMRGQAKEKQA